MAMVVCCWNSLQIILSPDKEPQDKKFLEKMTDYSQGRPVRPLLQGFEVFDFRNLTIYF